MDTDFTLKTEADDAPVDAAAGGDMAQLLREGRLDEFNARVAAEGPVDLSHANLRMTDLRNADLQGACLAGAYLRAADLRGQDLGESDLDGASLAGAKVSGVRFPDDIPAAEVMMSLAHGTRLRAGKP